MFNNKKDSTNYLANLLEIKNEQRDYLLNGIGFEHFSMNIHADIDMNDYDFLLSSDGIFDFYKKTEQEMFNLDQVNKIQDCPDDTSFIFLKNRN